MPAHVVISLRKLNGRCNPGSADQITTTLATLLSEFFKWSERSVFWNDDSRMNVDPFEGQQMSFFEQDWNFKVRYFDSFGRVYSKIHVQRSGKKLKIFRQLAELQLEHNAEIKSTIDLAWGVQHNKHKKKEVQDLPPDPSDPRSKERLQLIPIGQDTQRKRYWVVDGPCMLFYSLNFCICAYLRCVTAPVSIFVRNSGVCRPVLISSSTPVTYLFYHFCRFTTDICLHKSLEDGSFLPDNLVNTGGIYCHH